MGGDEGEGEDEKWVHPTCHLPLTPTLSHKGRGRRAAEFRRKIIRNQSLSLPMITLPMTIDFFKLPSRPTHESVEAALVDIIGAGPQPTVFGFGEAHPNLVLLETLKVPTPEQRF